MASRIIGKQIFRYKRIDSTNDEAKRLIVKGVGEGALVIAKEQTKGRGKPGSKWYSPKQVGLYLSAIIKPYKNPPKLIALTKIAAEAVVASILETTGLSASIKLPNDVLVNEKKVCGILVERVRSGEVIIGIGINVNN
ncbi:MAG: biotin--[acetyl-CoA-carboxylase] ligase, partial [Candidatus Margulisbacteria bacterium]|nr:biotin--[acetyl-CoA-carboxylase] ligase [Candidatus Margulisiibacteriota bacterium]